MTPRLLTRGVLAAACLLACGAAPVAAQTPPDTSDRSRPFEILDNSFLVEEAFNQDRGVVQSIFVWARSRTGAWEGSFTQEWPAPSLEHQFSYTVPFAGGDNPAHWGGVLLNYRYQPSVVAPGSIGFAPRISVILPTGRSVDNSDRPGLQGNLPFTKQLGDLHIHWNAGLTWLHAVPLTPTIAKNLTTPMLAASVVWRTIPLFNLMWENVLEFEEIVEDGATTRRRSMTTAPGFRWGWNVGDQQIVLGAALPVTFVDGETTVAGLTYFSYELPFRKDR